MTKIAFCGLGMLGTPMAGRLVDAGLEVTVWNRTAERTKPLAARGATVASSPAEAAAGADVAITVVSTGEALEEVVLGPAGVAAGLAEGSVLADMSTVGPDAIRALAPQLPRGIELVDAPVLGSVIQATEGSLKVFVGGSRESYGRLQPVFDILGAPVHVGDLGSGAAMKLVVNSTLFPVMAAIGEALTLGHLFGLDQRLVLDVLSGSAIGGTVRSKRERIESGTYPPNFKLGLARKDADLVARAGRDRGRPLPVSELARDLLAEADENGLSDLDYSALVAHIRGTPASLPDDGE